MELNFSQKEGVLFSGGIGKDNFRWIQGSGRYFLDPQTFDNIPASDYRYDEKVIPPGYTNLVITALAIQHSAWKFLARDGWKYKDAFLQEFPDANRIYTKAVWDAHTSLYAKGKLTVKEFLRFRLESRI